VIGNIFRFGAVHGNQHRGVPPTEHAGWAPRSLSARSAWKAGMGFRWLFHFPKLHDPARAACLLSHYTDRGFDHVELGGARSRSIGRLRPGRIVAPITPRALISRRASHNQRGRQLRRKI
jgi:hypothetical protein